VREDSEDLDFQVCSSRHSCMIFRALGSVIGCATRHLENLKETTWLILCGGTNTKIDETLRDCLTVQITSRHLSERDLFSPHPSAISVDAVEINCSSNHTSVQTNL
jgi:hypothetical protein